MLVRGLRGLVDVVPAGVTDAVRRSRVLAPVAEPVFAAAARPWHGRTVAVRSGPAEGLLLSVDRRSAVWLSGRVERPVQDALGRLLHPGAVFFDVGASVGFFSLLGARLVGDAGTVVAFEPDPEAATALEGNARRNGLANVVAVPVAASGRPGEVALEVSARAPGRIAGGAPGSRGARRLAVAATSLDAYVADHPRHAPAVVKIDAEGHEIEVLDGMRETLRDHRPALVIELHGTNAGVARALADAGYAAAVLDRPGPVADAPAWAHVLATPA